MRGPGALVVATVAAFAAPGAAACGSSDGGGMDGPGTAADGPSGDDAPDPPDADVDAPPGTPDAAPDAPGATTCGTALLYIDCDPGLDANCLTIAEPLRADDAAAALGIATLFGGNHDQAAFRALYDAGGFDVIVFESSSFDVDAQTAARLAAWVAAGGKLVFSYWDLDGGTVGATLRAALEVDTPASFNTPRSVHDDPASPVSLFTGVETLVSPLNFSNIGIDDGDELAPTAGGFIAARLTSTTGPGAIAVTHAGAVVVLGFLPIELVYALIRDDDADGKPDVEELYTNALGYLCGS